MFSLGISWGHLVAFVGVNCNRYPAAVQSTGTVHTGCILLFVFHPITIPKQPTLEHMDKL